MTEQGSDAWKMARLGKLTASRISDMMAKTKSGWGASRGNYAAQLVAERLTRVPQETYVNAAMQWGTETEPEARTAYEFIRNCEVQQVGFIPHPTIDMAGASPDGLVGSDGLLELKCPNTATHIETLLGGTIPEKYIMQMQWQMACTGRAWCDFASYDPRLPPEMRLFVARAEWSGEAIGILETQARIFLAEIDATVSTLLSKYGMAA